MGSGPWTATTIHPIIETPGIHLTVFLKNMESIQLLSNYLVIRSQHFSNRPDDFFDLFPSPSLLQSQKIIRIQAPHNCFGLGFMLVVKSAMF